jgi:ABC-2 type transport system ATP-binding protein
VDEVSVTAETQAIAVRNLRVSRGGQRVLPDLSVDVPAGVVTGLLGPSGCGKTTLIRSIVGLQIIQAGSITVDGRAAGASELRSQIGYMPQAPSVYLDLTVGENLRYFGRILRVGRPAIQATLATVGLSALEGQIAGRLSGGQLARVSLAVAMLSRPKVLILDEPTVGLDPVLREELWGTFRDLAARGSIVLISSHVMEEASYCDQLILMRDGRILAAGAPAELLARAGAETLSGAFIRLVRAGDGDVP